MRTKTTWSVTMEVAAFIGADPDAADLEELITIALQDGGLLRDLITITKIHAAPVAQDERLLTTKQMAARLGIDVKTLLRRRLKGQLQHEPMVLGRRGRAALRWRGNEVG